MQKCLYVHLQVFDFKLRHMSDDIAAIEASNNSLELQARNNAALASTLAGLRSLLEVDPDVQRLLEQPPFDPYRWGKGLLPVGIYLGGDLVPHMCNGGNPMV